MCGILGSVTIDPGLDVDLDARFAAAMARLNHRGPDTRGQYQRGNVRFGHTRLSILDLSPAGDQPMRSADGRCVITYNGEIYNFRELAREHGLTNLRSRSDTEVVLELFASKGVDSLRLLNGMFAFALHDVQARKLWLARDRLGIKPLYYELNAGGLTFASEIKGILALAPRTRACDVAALHEWLYFGNPLGGHTLYDGIRQLLPGHCLELDLNSLAHVEHVYWSLESEAAGTHVPAGRNIIDETRRLLEQAVQRQLVSDVPVGVFLSGGVDSSAITALASRHSEGRLVTYSAGFDFARRGADELPKARRVAAQYGTDHHEIHVTAGIAADLIEKLVCQHDMPFGDAANIPLYLLASQVRGHVKVVLQGDGGDELFCGYRRHTTLSYYRWLRPAARLVQNLAISIPGSARRQRILRYLHALAADDAASTMARLLSPEDVLSMPAAIFSPGIRRLVEQSDPFARHRECQRMFASLDCGNQMSLVDQMITLPDLFLEKVDRSTMAASLEVRVPFLDHDLVDFLARLPARAKMPGGRRKWLLKKALQGIVPTEVLHGPKVGLEVPFGAWLRGPLKPMFFDHLAAFERNSGDVIDTARVRQLFAETSAVRLDYRFLLWKLLNFVVWANNSKIEFSME